MEISLLLLREKQVGRIKYPKAIYLFGGLSDQPALLFGFASFDAGLM